MSVVPSTPAEETLPPALAAPEILSPPANTPNLEERPSPALIHSIGSIVERLPLGELFPLNQPLEVELGSGDGTFAIDYAKAHPETNYLGVERLLGRLRKIDRKGTRAGLRNLRLVRLEASYLVAFMLPPSSVRSFHIYFPDPWPKRRHHRRRLISERFAVALHRALEPGGTIYLRTDNADYFDRMLEVFEANPNFIAIQTPPDLAAFLTDFERVFLAQGLATRRAAFRSIFLSGLEQKE